MTIFCLFSLSKELARYPTRWLEVKMRHIARKRFIQIDGCLTGDIYGLSTDHMSGGSIDMISPQGARYAHENQKAKLRGTFAIIIIK